MQLKVSVPQLDGLLQCPFGLEDYLSALREQEIIPPAA